MKLLKYIFQYKKITNVDEKTHEERVGYYPIIPCVFEWGGKKTRLLDGLLDSGSDGIVIPLVLAEYLELNLIPEDDPMRVVGYEIERYNAKLNLTLGRSGRYVTLNDIEASVPKKEDGVPILIGRNPIFKLYEVTFKEGEVGGAIVLTPQAETSKKKKGKKRR